MAIVKAGTIAEFSLAASATVTMYCKDGGGLLELAPIPQSISNRWSHVADISGVTFYTATNNESMRIISPDDCDVEYVVGSASPLTTVPDSRFVSLVPMLPVTAPAATFAGLTVDDDGGNARLTSAGVHGLSVASEGANMVYVTWAGVGHTGVDGFYIVNTASANTKKLTLVLDYAADLGTPTVLTTGDKIELARQTIPANSIGAGGCIQVQANMSADTGAGAQDLTIELVDTSVAPVTLTAVDKDISAFDNVTTNKYLCCLGASVGTSASELLACGGSTGAANSAACDVTTDMDVVISIEFAAAEDTLTLHGYIINCKY